MVLMTKKLTEMLAGRHSVIKKKNKKNSNTQYALKLSKTKYRKETDRQV